MKRRGRKERKENRREGKGRKGEEERRGNVCKDEKRRGVKKRNNEFTHKENEKNTAPRSYFPGHAVNSRLKSIKEIDQYIAAKAIGSTENETIRRTLS